MRVDLAILSLAMIVTAGSAFGFILNAPAWAQTRSSRASSTPIARIEGWFEKYDAVRRKAQMNPTERQKADALLSKGLSIIMPGADKTESACLFHLLLSRNGTAAEEMKGLPVYPETEQLLRGYYQYFTDAYSLFGDYLKVQNNIMATNPDTGKPLMGELIARKQALESLDSSNKALDEQLRAKFHVPPYKYQ